MTSPAKSSKASASLKVPATNKGAASLVFFYTGDSKYTALCQETLKLKKAMEGYKKIVLLKHQQTPSWLDFSEKDEKLAAVIETPTKLNLFRYLKELTSEGYYIDLWLVGHGSAGSFRVSKGTYGENESCTAADVTANLSGSATGYTKIPIRMIWQTLCYGSTLNATWQGVGAKVLGGARHVNFYPNQYGKFTDQWNKGTVDYEDCYEESDSAASRTVVQTYILGDAKVKKIAGKWCGCPFAKTVLGTHECACDYFTTFWLSKSEYQNDLSGKENMNRSSEFIIGGDKSLTKNSKPTWA